MHAKNVALRFQPATSGQRPKTGTPNVPAMSINVVTAPLKQSSLRLPLSEDVQEQASLLSITMQHTIHLYCVMFDIKDSCLNHKSTTSAETA